MKPKDKNKLVAILFDSTRCIGCRSCEEACSDENDSRKRKWSEKSTNAKRKPPSGLSGDKWLHMSSHELPLPEGKTRQPFDWEEAGELKEQDQYNFVRHACMHCLEPACENACIVGALKKQKNGPVIYDPSKCMGCRYCMIACPFQIPKWEWHEALPFVRKCTMCYPLQQKGKIPACVESCPGDGTNGPALIFGTRHRLLYEGEKRIHSKKDNYHPHIFGRDELGGTGVLYLLPKDLTPELVDFPSNLGKRSIPSYAKSPQSTVPYWVGGLGTFCVSLNWIIQRRQKLMSDQDEENREHGSK